MRHSVRLLDGKAFRTRRGHHALSQLFHLATFLAQVILYETMATVSMHNGDMDKRISPVFRTLASPLRQRPFDLEKLRELARSDEFSDSESDGVSDGEGVEEDISNILLVSRRRAPITRKKLDAQRRDLIEQQKKSSEKASSSPKGDEWEIVDKSPTFMSVADGKTELGGESWFVQDHEL